MDLDAPIELLSLQETPEDKVLAFNPICFDEFLGQRIVKEKLKRDISVDASTDTNLGGGALLKFGSMTLDGSLKNLIREECTVLTEKVDPG